jgi:hypothetical protein
MYSTGLAIRPSLMLDSSHRDSFSRCSVATAKRRRQSCDIFGTVRAHRSARPASTGFSGPGTGVERSSGMNRGSRSRWALPATRSGLRLYFSRKWSSKKKTHTYQSVMRERSGPSQSGWV